MKRSLQFACVALAAALAGCAVHDGHEDEPAPIWWPTFLYRPTTHPTTEEYDMTRGTDPAVVDGSAIASARDVRADWNPVYAEHPVAPVASPDNLSHPVQPESPAAATLYPNRGQAALAADSATLYPPTNEFNGGPAHTASVFAHGPLAPTGYLGR
jgi:hypothetical protein